MDGPTATVRQTDEPDVRYIRFFLLKINENPRGRESREGITSIRNNELAALYNERASPYKKVASTDGRPETARKQRRSLLNRTAFFTRQLTRP
jgi:hypothetical protein